MDFSSVFAPISNQLREFEAELKRALETDSPVIGRITDHLYGSSGKRLRPALLFLASGEKNRSSLYAALAVELIQTAT